MLWSYLKHSWQRNDPRNNQSFRVYDDLTLFDMNKCRKLQVDFLWDGHAFLSLRTPKTLSNKFFEIENKKNKSEYLNIFVFLVFSRVLVETMKYKSV